MGKDWDKCVPDQPGDGKFSDIDNPYGRSKVRYGGTASYGKSEDVLQRQQEWHLLWLQESYRVLRPSGIIKAFSGTRTYHRLAAAMSEAGFTDIRLEGWLYGSGFPKSHNVARAINALVLTGGTAPKNLRMARMGESYAPTGQVDYRKGRMFSSEIEADEQDTELCETALPYRGVGTALKPAWEPVVVGCKPAT